MLLYLPLVLNELCLRLPKAPLLCLKQPAWRGKRGFIPWRRIPLSITELHERRNFARTPLPVCMQCPRNLFGRMPQRKATLALRPTIHLTSPSGTVGAFSVLNMLSRIRCSYVVYYYRTAYLPMYVKMRAARVLPCLDSCLPPAQCYRWSRCCCILFFSSSKSFWC